MADETAGVTPDAVRYQVVGALIVRDDHVLLVRGIDPVFGPYWSIPAGVVEPGELLPEALAREVWEETGLRISGAGRLAYAVHVEDRHRSIEGLTLVFQVDRWEGELRPQDPDEQVVECCFLPISVAAQRIEQGPILPITEPLLAYLSGDELHPNTWCYRRESNSEFQRVLASTDQTAVSRPDQSVP